MQALMYYFTTTVLYLRMYIIVQFNQSQKNCCYVSKMCFLQQLKQVMIGNQTFYFKCRKRIIIFIHPTQHPIPPPSQSNESSSDCAGTTALQDHGIPVRALGSSQEAKDEEPSKNVKLAKPQAHLTFRRGHILKRKRWVHKFFTLSCRSLMS